MMWVLIKKMILKFNSRMPLLKHRVKRRRKKKEWVSRMFGSINISSWMYLNHKPILTWLWSNREVLHQRSGRSKRNSVWWVRLILLNWQNQIVGLIWLNPIFKINKQINQIIKMMLSNSQKNTLMHHQN